MTLLQLLNKAGESTHVNEVTELLAHSSVKDGNLAALATCTRMLATTEPQNQMHMQNYQQVVGRMEGAAPATGITAEEGAVIVEELEATAPVIDQSYPDHVAIAVRSAVTDADLFLSYNLPEKAIVPLLGALPQAPRDVRLNQRLAALAYPLPAFYGSRRLLPHTGKCVPRCGLPGRSRALWRIGRALRAERGSCSIDFDFDCYFGARLASSSTPLQAAAPPAPWPTAASATPGHEIAAAAHPEFAIQEQAAARAVLRLGLRPNPRSSLRVGGFSFRRRARSGRGTVGAARPRSR